MSEENLDHDNHQWTKEILRQRANNKYPKWPNEAMVKLLFGGSNYLEVPFHPNSSWRVLDVGCGFANNLVPFADIGCECHGVDLTSEMVAAVQEVMRDRNYSMAFEVGHNRSLPYPDSHFDLLLSVNTLHYEGSEQNFQAALREFSRVLKPGGGIYISTVGPDHSIQRRAEVLGDHRYRVRDFGFRTDEEFFFCDNEGYLENYLTDTFENVEIGRVSETLMKLPLDFLVAVGHKPH